jgi:pyrroline-5-carboxylate reductase
MESGEHPALLRDKVCSPGGTTIAAVKALEEKGLRAALVEAVAQAARRSAELGKK